MGTPISEEEFLAMVRNFRESAFHIETRPAYALGYEQADLNRFLAGVPVPPPDLDWWQPWLERVARFTAEEKRVARVRILEEPPTDYQRWLLWATPWHAAAGEDIRYLPRSQAERIGLPLVNDWWLLDDERVILMAFTEAGEISGKWLLTDPVAVAPYRKWRDLAFRHATPAEQIAAA
jgi:hypothetical protein